MKEVKREAERWSWSFFRPSKISRR